MRVRFALVALLLGAATPVAAPASPACAEEGPHAVLVIDRGAEGGPLPPMCVSLGGAESVSGRDFILLAARQYEQVKDISFGYGGGALCMLADIGSSEEECFADGEPFWGYWQSDGARWQWSRGGFTSTRVEDGDIEGWSWDTEMGPAGRDQPPHPSFKRVCGYDPDARSGSPGPGGKPRERDGNDDDRSADGGGGDAGDERDLSGGGGAPPGGSAGPRTNRPRFPNAFPSAEPEPDERRINAAPDVSELMDSPTPDEAAADLPASAATAGSEDTEFPLAGALAVGATFAMAAVALLVVRKRPPLEPKD